MQPHSSGKPDLTVVFLDALSGRSEVVIVEPFEIVLDKIYGGPGWRSQGSFGADDVKQ